MLSLAAFLLVYTQIANSLRDRTEARLHAKIREFAQTRKDRGLAGLQEEFALEAEATGRERVFYRLLDPDGKQVAASDLTGWQGLDTFVPVVPETGEELKRLQLPGRQFSVKIITARLDDGFLLQTGLALDDNDRVLETCRETFSTAFLLILGAGGIGAWLIARKAMGGVRQVTEAAARIARGDLDQPIQSGNRGEEIEALAAMFNTMQEQIASLIGELRMVINNVAHDLRLPITRIRGVAETTLTRDSDTVAYQDMAVTVIEESDRLVGQINTILELAEIDAGVTELPMDDIDLAQVVGLAADLYQPAAEENGIQLILHAPSETITVSGNLHALQRLLANLLDNAIKFTPAGGKITISLTTEADKALLSVSDSGPGISSGDLERIFDRFYRADTSRSTPGNGLGLALVKTIVKAHHGTITVRSQAGAGSCFVVTLPRNN
ncbi:two-component sensor histidine kinase [Desulfolithobacter dissulfuricans]|uniref:histidine kinase n=1 Tax=Desulfolithobacter dissulfuricans TaxID=2795293 RepID=A0A915UA07_9BACT|nr:HAMP domain-containing sensor histidine kinase [Desulfolithobacter dissulfuricans]BCO09501.1 two-component sensor histidine kinase [Desulfolithobacter dissulfuricans]